MPHVNIAASSERTEGGEGVGRIQLVAVHAPGVEPGAKERIAQLIVAGRNAGGLGEVALSSERAARTRRGKNAFRESELLTR
jgi:hypothetical protein